MFEKGNTQPQGKSDVNESNLGNKYYSYIYTHAIPYYTDNIEISIPIERENAFVSQVFSGVDENDINNISVTIFGNIYKATTSGFLKKNKNDSIYKIVPSFNDYTFEIINENVKLDIPTTVGYSVRHSIYQAFYRNKGTHPCRVRS